MLDSGVAGSALSPESLEIAIIAKRSSNDQTDERRRRSSRFGNIQKRPGFKECHV
jgi:hypothetical protein